MQVSNIESFTKIIFYKTYSTNMLPLEKKLRKKLFGESSVWETGFRKVIENWE